MTGDQSQHSALSTQHSPFVERLRAFEQMLEQRMPEFQCSVHLCLGQEAVPEVLHELLRPEDWLFSTHRSHGHYLAKGGSEQRILDEILGLETGVNGGYSGSQSFCDTSINFHSTAVVGGLIGVATGVAYALKLQPHPPSAIRHPPLVVCCIGDGATEQGVFWESLNFASLHGLRVVYVCENNGLSVHAPLRLRQDRPLLQRVRSFGVYAVEGLSALSNLLSGQRGDLWLPAFVEIQCERQCRHVSAMEDLRETSVTGDQ